MIGNVCRLCEWQSLFPLKIALFKILLTEVAQFVTWQVVSIKGHICRTWHECKSIIQEGLWTLLNWSISIICCWIPKSAHHPQRKQLAFAGYWVHEAFILISCLTVDWNIKKKEWITVNTWLEQRLCLSGLTCLNTSCSVESLWELSGSHWGTSFLC